MVSRFPIGQHALTASPLMLGGGFGHYPVRVTIDAWASSANAVLLLIQYLPP